MNICVLVEPLSGLDRRSREAVRTPYDVRMRMVMIFREHCRRHAPKIK